MTFEEFNKRIAEIYAICDYEEKLFAIGADFPAMSEIAARLLEQLITGKSTADGVISWWLYELGCGKHEGELSMYDGTVYRIASTKDLWDVMHNEELYNFVIGEDFEQLEIEL